MKFKELPIPDEMRRQMAELISPKYAGTYRRFESLDGKVRVMMSRTQAGYLPDGKPDLRWHLSVSAEGQTRLPTWEEMKAVRQALKPDVFFVIGMPPEKHWLNYGEVLHLAEVKDENLIQQWIFEGEKAKADAEMGVGYGATLEDSIRAERSYRARRKRV